MRDDDGMPVAVVSVIASSLITFASLAFTYRQGREQRRHDAAQAFQSRAWEFQRDGHLKLLEVFAKIKDQTSDGYKVATNLEIWREDISEHRVVILAYGSDACQRDIEILLSHLDNLQSSPEVGSLVLKALKAEEEWNELRNPWQSHDGPILPLLEATRATKQAVRDAYVYDAPALEQAVQNAIASTRGSLRGDLN